MIPKFRAWDKKHKEICEVWQIHFDLKFVHCFNKWARNLKFEDCILMQSTGLFDKNGVEIFEGDILTEEGSFENDGWDYATIEFDETYYLTWKNEGTCQSITECENYSVAGNIYENPELLEVGNE